MTNNIEQGVSKAFEKMLPGLTDILQNKNYKVSVRRTGPNSVEVVTADGTPYELNEGLIEQMNIMINVASLIDVTKEQGTGDTGPK